MIFTFKIHAIKGPLIYAPCLKCALTIEKLYTLLEKHSRCVLFAERFVYVLSLWQLPLVLAFSF